MTKLLMGCQLKVVYNLIDHPVEYEVFSNLCPKGASDFNTIGCKNRGIRNPGVRQCLGFHSADSYANEDQNRLYKNPNIV